MLRGTPTRKEGKSLGRKSRTAHREKSPTRFPGIKEDAKALKVSRTHLWYVLTGQRDSASLLARYEHLKRQQAAGS